ncbi:DUF4249 domain-containing protein [Sphingobacterium hotanense]|uniref:DUF4249 domain-containing protein n=1 Tax=Sphingobacterium hotanense TaxID=649196 RepID=A0ABT7NQD3_9SPHI|nr:DUF4249 domain-containing protein [Sphingobacterium hotanense]MDM1049228.1 DUF4249 domain-containing protein [Sphingobacterium hotanense]
MRSIQIYLLGIFVLLGFASCEEKIDVDLNTANAKVVIEADLNNLDRNQEIMVSRTVAFDESRAFEPVDNAVVSVVTGSGSTFNFESIGGGRYSHSNMGIIAQQEYTLNVSVDGQTYSSTTRMPNYVEVDSVGVTKENIFNEDYYFVNLSFDDPEGVENYYKYNVEIIGVGDNATAMQFNSVYSDKFNDGLHVTHQIGGRNAEIANGDNVRVRRYCIAKDVYKYWSEYQSTNPGSASPANPTSNISNGALGYFSVAGVKEFVVEINDSFSLED